MKIKMIEEAPMISKSRNKKDVLIEINYLLRKLRKRGDIRANLHKISLSGMQCFKEIENALGDLFMEKKFEPEKRMPNYKKQYLKRIGPVLLAIFLEPKSPFLPKCYLEFVTPDELIPAEIKTFLAKLNNKLPCLKVSRVEYTLDIFHANPNVRKKLFILLQTFLSIPYQRKVRLMENEITGARTFIIGRTRIYERGPDEKRIKHSWHQNDINRIRIEWTSDRRQLLKNGIGKLHDFLKSPKFHSSHKDRYQFKHFKHKRLPKYYQRYNTNSFHKEKEMHLKKIKNIYQYIKDFKPLDPLKIWLRRAMKQFDEEWQNNKK